MSLRNNLRAAVSHKCAECHRGDMFITPVMSFDRPFDMHERCPECNANYFPEPGFYYGAMFVSSLLSTVACLVIIMTTYWLLDWSLVASFLTLTAIVAVAFVWWFRFARALWLNMMVRYRPEKTRKVIKVSAN